MADPEPTPIKRRGFADPKVREKAARARAERQKAAKAERAPKRKAPSKKDVEAVIALVIGGVAGKEDFVDSEDRSLQAEQVRAAIERIRSWCPPPDRLEAFETAMIADVTADELIKRPRLIEPFLGVLDKAKDFKILAVCLAIAIPRLVNHGALPAFIGRLVYPPILSAAGRKGAVEFEAPAEPPPSEPIPQPEDNGSVESA